MDSNSPILVAEDDRNDAFILERALREVGVTCPIYFCQHGFEVRAYLSGEGIYSDRRRFALPWLLITDLKMPKMDGLEFLKWRQQHPEYRIIPTIVLSASGQPSDIEEAYLLGANSYLVKPSGYNYLTEMMKVLLIYWRMCATPQPVQFA